MKIADLGQIDLTPGGGSKEVTIRDTTITYGISRDGKYGAIDLVTTPRSKRGEGSAREALTTFLQKTDAAGITLFLTAQPRDKGITMGGLVDFYKSLGFKRNSGRARDFRSMNGMVRQSLKEASRSTEEFLRVAREIIERDFHARIDLYLTHDVHDPTAIEIDQIFAWEQGKGWGTEAMNMICSLADKYQVVLTLGVANEDDGFSADPGDPSEEVLIGWYERFGFVERPSAGDRYLMIRQPSALHEAHLNVPRRSES